MRNNNINFIEDTQFYIYILSTSDNLYFHNYLSDLLNFRIRVYNKFKCEFIKSMFFCDTIICLAQYLFFRFYNIICTLRIIKK